MRENEKANGSCRVERRGLRNSSMSAFEVLKVIICEIPLRLVPSGFRFDGVYDSCKRTPQVRIPMSWGVEVFTSSLHRSRFEDMRYLITAA